MAQYLHLPLTADEFRQAAASRPLQARAQWSEPDNFEQFDWLADAPDPGWAKSFELEISFDQCPHISANDSGTRGREGLEPRGQTGRMPNRAIFGVLGASL